jgi:Tol biopolymer transport system component
VSQGFRLVARRDARPARQPQAPAFERAQGWIAVGGAGITAVDPSDPSNRIVLTTARLDAFDRPVAWAPDGSGLLFVRNSYSGADFERSDLYLLRSDGTEVRLTTGGADTVPRPLATVVGGSFSPDGRQVVFAQVTGFSEEDAIDSLFVVPATGGVPRRIEDGGEGAAGSHPAWSPDGERVYYFGRFRRGGDDVPGLAVTNADGTGDGFLVGDLLLDEVEGETAGLAWSPDGTRLAFAGTSEAGHSGVYVVGADGSGLTELIGSDDERYAWPTWAPDGSRIAFVAGDRVLSVNLDGTDLGEVAGVPADGRIAWNPVA